MSHYPCALFYCERGTGLPVVVGTTFNICCMFGSYIQQSAIKLKDITHTLSAIAQRGFGAVGCLV